MTKHTQTIAVLGGTGDLGWGLALQLARAGHAVIIGSRQADKAERAAAELLAAAPGVNVKGAANPEAAAAAGIVIMTVPFASHRPTLESVREAVQGKIFVDTTVPLVPPKVMRVQLPPEGSAAKQAQALLGNGVRVVSAFQNIAAAHLREGDLHDGGCDVLVAGDDPDARETVVTLAQDIGLRAWHAGPIDNSVVAEALTSVLIFLNKKYRLDGAGIRITGEVRD
jgi:NADPH-dependent F420 reductase